MLNESGELTLTIALPADVRARLDAFSSRRKMTMEAGAVAALALFFDGLGDEAALDAQDIQAAEGWVRIMDALRRGRERAR